MVCDYLNLLIQCKSWNPSSLHLTTVDVPTTPIVLPSSVPFAPALPICVPAFVPDAGLVDVCLDYFITLGLLQPPTADHLAYAVHIMIKTFAWPPAPLGPPIRSVLICQKKLTAIRTTDSPRLVHQHQVPDDIPSILSPTKHQYKTTISPTPQLTSMEKFFSFYNANGEHIQIHTDNENHTLPPYLFIWWCW